jgi:hypothetical protein
MLIKGVDLMDIAAISIGFNQMKVSQEVNMSVLKIAMDTAKEQAVDLIKLLEVTVSPYLGGNIETRA